MKKTQTRMILFFLFSFLTLSCGKKEKDHATPPAHAAEESSSEDHDDHDDHGSESPGAGYVEGKGIRLSEETKKSIGLELMEVGEKDLPSLLRLQAQVYRTASEATGMYAREKTGHAYATALVSKEMIGQLSPGQKLILSGPNDKNSSPSGRVWRVERSQLDVLGKGEVLLELEDPGHTWTLGAFVELSIPLEAKPRRVLSIPVSAVLESSTGSHVFVGNGEHLLRTGIQTGLRHEEQIEITEGLYEGDVIAVKPVETLHLIELRATKGGGHSH